MKALLLAAGYATRLYPLTRDCAKPLLEVGGRPMLSHLLDRVAVLPGMSEIVVVANHRFIDQFEAWASDLASGLAVRVLDDGSTSDDDKLGAIGDLSFALDEMGDEEDLLVVAGDNLLLFDLEPSLAEYRRRQRPLLLVRDVDPAVQSRYNEVGVSASGRVTRFREKPQQPRSGKAAICLYFLPPGIASFVHRYLGSGGNPDAPGYFIEWLVAETEVHALPLSGEWFDVGSLETLAQARARLSPNAEEAGK